MIPSGLLALFHFIIFYEQFGRYIDDDLELYDVM